MSNRYSIAQEAAERTFLVSLIDWLCYKYVQPIGVKEDVSVRNQDILANAPSYVPD